MWCGRWRLELKQPLVVGIVNVTPDSFSDAGRFYRPEHALAHAQQMLKDGAAMLDIGAESTRPNATEVSAEQEWARLQPVLEEVLRWNIPIAVDTRNPSTMQRALQAGVDCINDVSGMTQPAARKVLAEFANAGICVMHMRGNPATMQQLTQYEDVVQDVKNFLAQQLQQLQLDGIDLQRVCLDPGFGFAKTPEQNWQLLRGLGQLQSLGAPIYVGLSRKSMLQKITGRNVDERLAGSLAAALAAITAGAKLLRVHDVAATVDALKVWQHTFHSSE